MNKKDLIDYIKGNLDLDNGTRQILEDTIEKYPYFQTANLLLAKNLYLTDKEAFENILPRTATLCADRRKLFYLINNEKYKNFITKPTPLHNNARTDQILDSYLTSFSIEEEESDIIISEETIVSSDYMAYIQNNEVEETIDVDNNEVSEFKHQDIIDSFLEKAETNDISLQPLQKETKRNTTPDTETTGNSFLTETLAKIYIKQKKYEQALAIIQQLSLNFPKKSAYFADQIRFLELLILNEKNK